MKKIFLGLLMSYSAAFADPCALVNANVVVGVIVVTDAAQCTTLGATYQFAVDVLSVSPQPAPGWTYNGSTFSAPAVTYIALPTSVVSPNSGDTVSPFSGTNLLAVNNTATLSALTIVFPPNPQDGDELILAARKAITTLTLTPSAGQTILNPIASAPAGGTATYRWIAQFNVWFRRQ